MVTKEPAVESTQTGETDLAEQRFKQRPKIIQLPTQNTAKLKALAPVKGNVSSRVNQVLLSYSGSTKAK